MTDPAARRSRASPLAAALLWALSTGVASANPVILADGDLSRAKFGLGAIFVAEAVLAGTLLARRGLRFRRIVAPVVVINLATFAIFANVLVVYDRYDLRFADQVLPAEFAIVVLEAVAFWLLARWPAMRKADTSPLGWRPALVVSALCNLASLAAGFVWHGVVGLTAAI
jgi:hypothetical protein